VIVYAYLIIYMPFDSLQEMQYWCEVFELDNFLSINALIKRSIFIAGYYHTSSIFAF